MTKIKDIIKIIEAHFPPSVQESYDNSGLITGNINNEISGILITIDINEQVIKEALEKKCNMIIAHHPIIFHPLKKITGSNYIERTIIAAIKNDIAIYGAHTSVDNNFAGLNKIICDKLNIENYEIISPLKNLLYKLVVFVPNKYASQVRQAIFSAGGGEIGNYNSCSYNLQGKGTFKALENTNPFVGKKGELHTEAETRIETVFPDFLRNKILNSMMQAHPYEEVAYDIYPIENTHKKYGAGLIGNLKSPIDEIIFLNLIKEKLKLSCLKHSEILHKKVKKVAICTGACSFLINEAVKQGADVFISSEFKYDQYISAQKRIILVDAGHYETEIYIKKLFYDLITKNFTKFAVEFSENFTNPVKYL